MYIGLMVDSQEKPQLNFKETGKNEVFSATRSKIEDRFHEIINFPKNERPKIIFGAVFEELVREENRENHTETEKQKQLRQLIESMYSQAELILGTAHERPSKPDGVSVSFDDKGRLIIDEILEFKSSENAFLHGLNKSQPPKTFETIGNIVTILNKLLAGEKTENIKPIDQDLSLDKRIKRDGQLQQIKTKLSTVISKGNVITYSPDIIYKMIIPKGVDIPTHDPDYLLNEYGYAIKLEIVESRFSKKDIHSIIDHYQETP